MSDAEIDFAEDALFDAIADDAEDAAFHAWGAPGRPIHRPNPHPDGSEHAAAWERAFWQAYARHNH